jgi:hypothetical protein
MCPVRSVTYVSRPDILRSGEPGGTRTHVAALARHTSLKDWPLRSSGHGFENPFVIAAHGNNPLIGASGRYCPSYHAVISRGPRFSDSLALNDASCVDDPAASRMSHGPLLVRQRGDNGRR